MKFIAKRNKLQKKIKFLESAIDVKYSVYPRGFLVEADNEERVTLKARGPELNILADMNVEVETKGKCVIPAIKTGHVISAFPASTEVSIELTDKHKLALRSVDKTVKTKFDVEAIPVDEIYDFDKFSQKKSFTIKADVLKGAIGKALVSIAKDDVRAFLNGVCFHYSDGILRFVSTDGKRLTLIECEEGFDRMSEDFRVLVPQKVLLEFLKILEGNEEIFIYLTKSKIMLKTVQDNERVIFYSTLIDGTFPDYEKMTDRKFSKQISVSTDKLKKIIDYISKILDQTTKRVIFTFEGKALTVDTYSADFGTIQDEIELETEEERFQITFDYQFLNDFLKLAVTETITFSFIDEKNIFKVVETDAPTDQFFIMPMNLSSQTDEEEQDESLDDKADSELSDESEEEIDSEEENESSDSEEDDDDDWE